MTFARLLLAGGVGIALTGAAWADDDTISIGVLHSLSGTMAISETTLKDTVLMMVDQQNAGAVCWASRSRRWSSIRPRTGRSLPKRRGN